MQILRIVSGQNFKLHAKSMWHKVDAHVFFVSFWVSFRKKTHKFNVLQRCKFSSAASLQPMSVLRSEDSSDE